jgi:hypothetical protein
MSAVTVFDQTNSAPIDKATQGSTSRVAANTDVFGEPKLREAEAMPAFETGVSDGCVLRMDLTLILRRPSDGSG